MNTQQLEFFQDYNVELLKETLTRDTEYIKNFLGDVKNIKCQHLEQYDTLHCIDGRYHQEKVSCFGGDAAEWLLALRSIELTLNIEFTEQQQYELFMTYITSHQKQKFYFHTDTLSVRNWLGTQETDEDAIEKQFQNADYNLQQQLLETVADPKHIGCGHLKFSLIKEEYQMRPALIINFMKNFYKLYWEKNDRVNLVILRKAHNEQAVLVVETDQNAMNQAYLCPKKENDEQVFIYYPQAEQNYRKKLLQYLSQAVQEKVQQTFDQSEILQKMNDISQIQTSSTTQALAGSLPIFKITFK